MWFGIESHILIFSYFQTEKANFLLKGDGYYANLLHFIQVMFKRKYNFGKLLDKFHYKVLCLIPHYGEIFIPVEA